MASDEAMDAVAETLHRRMPKLKDEDGVLFLDLMVDLSKIVDAQFNAGVDACTSRVREAGFANAAKMFDDLKRGGK